MTTITPHLDRTSLPVRTGSRRRTRTTARLAHLAVAGVIGTYVYAPDHITDVMQLPLQLAGIPLATWTGLYLWKPAWFRRRRSVRAEVLS